MCDPYTFPVPRLLILLNGGMVPANGRIRAGGWRIRTFVRLNPGALFRDTRERGGPHRLWDRRTQSESCRKLNSRHVQ